MQQLSFPPPRDANPLIQKDVFSFFQPFYQQLVSSRNKLIIKDYQNLFATLFQTYPRFLLLAEPGTGKTIMFLEAVERAKKSGLVRNVVIFESSVTLKNNVVREIYKVINTTNIPFNADNKRFIKAFKKQISNFYTITTYKKFFNKYLNESLDTLRSLFFNTIFIWDEAHRFIGASISKTSEVGISSVNEIASKKELEFFYYLYEKVLLNSHKLILVTATPLTTDIEQIIPYMRLLGITENISLSVPLPQLKKQIISTFLGYTSFVKSQLQEFVNWKYKECIPAKIKSFPSIEKCGSQLYFSEMKGTQLSTYFYYDTPSRKGEYGGVNLTQAGAFTFPDGSIKGKVSSLSYEEDDEMIFSKGVEDRKDTGLGKYVENVSKKYDLPGSYEFKNTFKKSENPDLRDLSCKFASIIDIENKHENTPGTAFIYTGNMKNGGGSIILSLILERYGGFTNYRKSKKQSNKTYVTINTEMTEEEKDEILAKFNSPENVTGNKIRLIIGTSQLREGISFHHIRRVHLLNRAWTYAEDFQSIFRSLRAHSHDDLYKYLKEKRMNANITVDVYKHAAFAVCKGSFISNDFHIEKTNIERQTKLKCVIEGLKEAAIDKLFFEKKKMITMDHPKQEIIDITSKPTTYLVKDSFFNVVCNAFSTDKSSLNKIRNEKDLTVCQKNTLLERNITSDSKGSPLISPSDCTKYINKVGSQKYTNLYLLKNSIDIYGKFAQKFNNRARLIRYVNLKEENNFHYYFFSFLKQQNFNPDLFLNLKKFLIENQRDISATTNISDVIEKFYNEKKVKIFGVLNTESGDFKVIDRRVKESNKGKSCFSYDKKELSDIYGKVSGVRQKGKLGSKEFYCENLQKEFGKKKLLVKV